MGLRFAVGLSGVAIALATAASGCGPAKNSNATTRVKASGAGSGAGEVVLIATERSDRGGRLVGIAANGARVSELTELRGKVILDRSPMVSVNGQWVVFASNRERDQEGLAATSLWLVPTRGGGVVRLTSGESIDRDPRFSADGRWLYFCSDRAGTFDLYRARFSADDGTIGPASLVVQGAGQILSPSLSPDGADVAFMEVDDTGASRLWRASVNGEPAKVALTEGPADMTPAWGPDGLLAFASSVPGRADADIYLMPATGGERTILLDTTITDETGPRWSEDGRYIFAIGMYRSATDGKPLLGSVIAIDRKELTPQWRALHDPATVETRIGLGLLPGTIDAQVLHANKNYKDALKAVLMREALRNESRQSREAP